jgi:hypothetical protein
VAYYDNPGERDRLIAGLLSLAALLQSSPDVPAPESATVFVFPPHGGNAERRAEIDSIAARIGAAAQEEASGHYTVSRYFGTVEYRAVSIDCDNHANPDGE